VQPDYTQFFFGSVGEWSGCAPPMRAAGVGACVSTEMVSGHGVRPNVQALMLPLHVVGSLSSQAATF
jgi:hypothetical protein